MVWHTCWGLKGVSKFPLSIRNWSPERTKKRLRREEKEVMPFQKWRTFFPFSVEKKGKKKKYFMKKERKKERQEKDSWKSEHTLTCSTPLSLSFSLKFSLSLSLWGDCDVIGRTKEEEVAVTPHLWERLQIQYLYCYCHSHRYSNNKATCVSVADMCGDTP